MCKMYHTIAAGTELRAAPSWARQMTAGVPGTERRPVRSEKNGVVAMDRAEEFRCRAVEAQEWPIKLRTFEIGQHGCGSLPLG